MNTKEVFISALMDKSVTNMEIVEKYIMFGTPYIFKDNEQTYYELKRQVSNFFSTSISNVILVGSSKLGFSIAPRKLLRNIQDDSDIDIVIIDEDLFDSYWEKLFEFNISIVSRNEKEDELYGKFLEYFFKGWLRPDYFPFKYDGKSQWFDFFYSISYKKYDKRKVTGAIFKNEYFFKKYHESNINSIREVVKQ